MSRALRSHWPEYLAEALSLGLFMVSAGLFGTLLEYPHSPVHMAIPDAGVRRGLMGLAMGLTAVGLIYSPWGRRSGAHMNPAVTLAFARLAKLAGWDAAFYIAAQTVEELTGVLLVQVLLGTVFVRPPVLEVVTVPGPAGPAVAFAAEVGISAALMGAVLVCTNHPRLAPYTGWVAGTLLMLFVTFESPFSGTSLNPARSLASALPAGVWRSFWIYLAAPLAGMLGAAEGYIRLRGLAHVHCAKLQHHHSARCIFRCNYRNAVPTALS